MYFLFVYSSWWQWLENSLLADNMWTYLYSRMFLKFSLFFTFFGLSDLDWLITEYAANLDLKQHLEPQPRTVTEFYHPNISQKIFKKQQKVWHQNLRIPLRASAVFHSSSSPKTAHSTPTESLQSHFESSFPLSGWYRAASSLEPSDRGYNNWGEAGEWYNCPLFPFAKPCHRAEINTKK